MRGRAKERIREIENNFDPAFIDSGIGSWTSRDSGTRNKKPMVQHNRFGRLPTCQELPSTDEGQ